MTTLLATPPAHAGSGIIEKSTSLALVHPIVMGVLFLGTVYAGYTGLTWRKAREIGDEIRALKKATPATTEDEGLVSSTPPAVAALEAERKDLLAGGPRDKHWLMGNILLASGVGIAIEGCANTFMRTGKLFPGPHLYAGAAIVALWAGAASLVPAMQKGNDTARSAHIAMNATSSFLFLWQVSTGLDIVNKVFQFTQWP